MASCALQKALAADAQAAAGAQTDSLQAQLQAVNVRSCAAAKNVARLTMELSAAKHRLGVQRVKTEAVDSQRSAADERRERAESVLRLTVAKADRLEAERDAVQAGRNAALAGLEEAQKERDAAIALAARMREVAGSRAAERRQARAEAGEAQAAADEARAALAWAETAATAAASEAGEARAEAAVAREAAAVVVACATAEAGKAITEANREREEAARARVQADKDRVDACWARSEADKAREAAEASKAEAAAARREFEDRIQSPFLISAKRTASIAIKAFAFDKADCPQDTPADRKDGGRPKRSSWRTLLCGRKSATLD
uniref:Uncharacterized protein n=1 Tax=Auxenochlorella protothecoides TaxID=3075 RepID=A0A1D1ZSR5_AUXPR